VASAAVARVLAARGYDDLRPALLAIAQHGRAEGFAGDRAGRPGAAAA
jgi:hypothetical protein